MSARRGSRMPKQIDEALLEKDADGSHEQVLRKWFAPWN